MIAAVDYNAVNSDWGFTPIPSTNMSPVALFSFAEGSDPTNGGYGTNNYSKILITPVCNTYLYVDINGDGTPDKVSFNNDIDVNDAAVPIGASTTMKQPATRAYRSTNSRPSLSVVLREA